jgi:hypothetical protein
MKYFVYAIIAVVAALIIAGFFVVGSPREERLRRFDERRVQDLQFLQSEIVNYWRGKEKLPDNLAELEDSIRGTKIPSDPENTQPYVYEVLGAESFKLCAIFSLAGAGTPLIQSPEPASVESSELLGQNWDHRGGPTCFERRIDKDLFPPYKKTD